MGNPVAVDPLAVEVAELEAARPSTMVSSGLGTGTVDKVDDS